MMKKAGRGASVLLIALLLTLLGAMPAHAGGPTSVLLVSPGTERTASLYYSSVGYDQLAQLVGAYDDVAAYADTPEPASPGNDSINVTWLIHDVSVWRVDRIYVGGPDGPWIGTETPENAEFVRWHQPSDPAALTALLSVVGVSGPVGADQATPSVSVAPPTTVAAAPGAQPTTVAIGPAAQPVALMGTASGGPGWSWAIGGLAVGGFLGLAGPWLLARGRSRLAAARGVQRVDLDLGPVRP